MEVAQIILNKVFTIESNKVNPCPYRVYASRKELVEILQTLTEKDLGLIKQPKYYPEKRWLIKVIYALDSSNPIFHEKDDYREM